MEDKIPQTAIDLIASYVNEKSNKSYQIPTVGNKSNVETPQIFEIVPFNKIDDSSWQVFAIDGSTNSQSFYNGVSVGLYRGGYVCFKGGKQIRMNNSDDPVVLGKAYTPEHILILNKEHMFTIYNELMELEPVKKFIKFLGAKREKIFAYDRDVICDNLSKLLGFCQDVLEWALVYEIVTRKEIKSEDFILRDGTLRSVNIRQPHLVKLGKLLREKGVYLIAVTKNSSIKLELSYTFKQIDNYLQEKLKLKYPFKTSDPKSQKLCCWFEVSGDVLEAAYEGPGNQFRKKGITGGRGIGLFFAARLDYVEKLQNYDWIIVDLNILDVVPGIEKGKLERDYKLLEYIFNELTRLTQEHYILGYPYPLVEAHNFVTLKSDFKEELVNRVKHSMYFTQFMDNVDIENMFLDIHSRF